MGSRIRRSSTRCCAVSGSSLALATAGLVQIARGNAFSAASSLLWHATDLLRELLPREGAALAPARDLADRQDA